MSSGYEETFANKVEKTFVDITYIKGYKNQDSKRVQMRCDVCGFVGLRGAGTIRQYFIAQGTYRCEGCGTRHQPKSVREISKTNRGESFENRYKENFNQDFMNLMYLGGYEHRSSVVRYECKTCGAVGEVNANTTRFWSNGTNQRVCDSCGFNQDGIQIKELCLCCDTPKTNLNKETRLCMECTNAKEREAEKVARDKERTEQLKARKQRNRIAKENRAEIRRRRNKTKSGVNNCIHCGKEFTFIGHLESVCNECIKERRKNAKVVRRMRKLKNGNINHIDTTITLDRLIKRDNNVCYLCGGQCDKGDTHISNGYIAVGKTYPSTDHVMPLSKGGTHTWDNVKLAHHYCNTIKSDTV